MKTINFFDIENEKYINPQFCKGKKHHILSIVYFQKIIQYLHVAVK